ncbi:hypothetical protein GCM10010964_37160 [Caldovatus sediminis]|uniref:Uncharacterized protein n=1 Tax=Caldovatus sediminis TaxID=2041189 RepID=A0A8J2ZDY2_9PROT|nr:hypothetical protein GCM10010964_37160 [Caldovatus sediminis]
MRLPGAPSLPRCPLGREPSPTNAADLEAMRRRVWREQGVVALRLEDITDPWLRQALTNEATRRWGPRNGGMSHGR